MKPCPRRRLPGNAARFHRQSFQRLVIPRPSFQRLVKNVVRGISDDMNVTNGALGALQEATEAYASVVFEKAQLLYT